MKPRPVQPPPPTLIGLLLVTGALAVVGGLAMLFSDGRWLGLTPTVLDPTPFDTYRIPGLVLAVVVGGSQLAAGIATLRRRPGYRRLVVIAAIILGGWLVIELLMIGVHWLQFFILLVAIVEVGLVASNLPPAQELRAARRRKRR